MLRGAVLGIAGALALTGTAAAQTMPWVSLEKGGLAGCNDAIKQFQTRWLSAVAYDRDAACASTDAELCSLMKGWHDDWTRMSPADFMMDAPADCGDCVDERMIDEFIDPAFSAAVPVIIVHAGGTKPAAPAIKGDYTDGSAFMPVVYHCLSTLWVAKLFKSGQSLEGVRITAEEGGYLDTTPEAFDGMVRSLTAKYGKAPGLAGATTTKPAAPKPPSKPARLAADAVRVAVRECGDADQAPARRIDACTKAIDGKVEGAELVLAYWARSVMRLETGDVGGAIDDADLAGELYGQDYSVQNARCWSRAVGNIELDVARQACTLAIRLAPDEASVYDSRGLVGLRQERWMDAWNDYDEAVFISPDFGSALYGRGLAALGLGRMDEARADLAEAVELDPSIASEYAGFGIEPDALRAAAPEQPRTTGSGGHVGRAKQSRNGQ